MREESDNQSSLFSCVNLGFQTPDKGPQPPNLHPRNMRMSRQACRRTHFPPPGILAIGEELFIFVDDSQGLALGGKCRAHFGFAAVAGCGGGQGGVSQSTPSRRHPLTPPNNRQHIGLTRKNPYNTAPTPEPVPEPLEMPACCD